MINSKLKQTLAALTVTAALALAPVYATASDKISEEAMQKRVEEGKKLAFGRADGNCLACHMIPSGTSPGNIGPALIAMKMRYPDRAKLFDKLWGKDELKVPYSMMPYFGQNGILTDEEINKVVDYLYTL